MFERGKRMESVDATLIEILKRVIKRLPIILLCMVVGGGMAVYQHQHYAKTTYTAHATLMAICNNDVDMLKQGYNNVSLAKELMPTYIQILCTDEFMNKIIEETGVDYTSEEIQGMIGTSTVENTSIFKIYVTGENEEDTMAILNAIISQGPQAVYDVLKEGYFQKIDASTLPLYSYREGMTRPLLIGVSIGAVIPCCIIIALALLDTSIRNEQQIELYYHLKVLGSIPNIKAKK